ncbi:hypothetical protein OUZ56_012734 [Daphnia magna]|uniref:Uncharacterized protein n=1 Tax=Daphnia magna TaxID=35525 RepID=A0ABQ9Z3W9_9CRUS|nr:hypothetical protein OUZ56_012734 [Daphnia magna]
MQQLFKLSNSIIVRSRMPRFRGYFTKPSENMEEMKAWKEAKESPYLQKQKKKSENNDCDAVEPDDPLALLETKSPVKKMGYTAPHSRERRTRGGRLKSLLKRLKRTPEFRSAYHKEIEQLQAENFTEEADLNYKGVRTYLPHYPVVRYPTGQNNHKDSTGIRWGGITIRNMDQASTMFWKTALISTTICLPL